MKAEEKEFNFIQDEKVLEVPFFQRGYVWSEENWGELLDNLFDQSQSHFIGSIILKQHLDGQPGAVERTMIIDGQQRLTTLSILLRACYDSLSLSSKDDDWIADQHILMTKSLMYQKSVISGEWTTKVIHSRLDAEDYRAVIFGKWTECYKEIMQVKDEEDGTKTVSKILHCYHYFRNDLGGRSTGEILGLWDMLVGSTVKMIVKIDLSSDENEQAIFDTVNTAGVRLRSSDTIKNALFQRALECASDNASLRQDIIDFYSDTWDNTFFGTEERLRFWQSERSVGRLIRDNLEVLLRSVAIIKGFYDPTDDKLSALPVLFKAHARESSIEDIRALVQDICLFAATYREHFVGLAQYSFWRGKSRYNRIFNRCDFSPFNPYILKTLNESTPNTDLPEEEPTLEQFAQLESYVTRHIICGISTKDFDRECLSLLCNEKTLEDLLNDKDDEINDKAVEAACRMYRTFTRRERG